MTVYDQILAAVSGTPNFSPRLPNESDQTYLKRLVHLGFNLPEPQWESLGDTAQQWFNNALEPAETDENGEELPAEIKAELDLPEGYPVAKAVADTPAPVRRRVVSSEPKKPEPKAPSVYDIALKTVQSVKADFAAKRADESDQLFLARMLRHLTQNTPEAIQEWVSTADAALDAGKPIPLPTGYPVVGNGHDGDAQLPAGIAQHLEKVAKGEAPVRRNRKVKTEPKAKAPRPTRVKAPRKPRARNENSVTTVIREEVTRTWDPTKDYQDGLVTAGQLGEMLSNRGLATKQTTIHQTRAAHIASLRVALNMGWTPPTAS